MARATGPLMSLAASGSVAKTLTFAHWKGRPYVRQLVTPANPKSTNQYYTRSMMAFLSKAWTFMNLIDATWQPTWETLAKMTNISPFNAFVQYNLKRWTQGMGAQTAHPAVAGSTLDTYATVTKTPGVRQITVTFATLVEHDGFGIAIQVDAANGAAPALKLTRSIVPAVHMGISDPFSVIISNLTPGTYSVGVRQFTIDGTLGAQTNVTQNIIVT